MKEINLTDRDYREIKDLALSEWKEKSISYKTAEEFVCRCYVNAFTSFCRARGYSLLDGKVYVKELDSK